MLAEGRLRSRLYRRHRHPGGSPKGDKASGELSDRMARGSRIWGGHVKKKDLRGPTTLLINFVMLFLTFWPDVRSDSGLAAKPSQRFEHGMGNIFFLDHTVRGGAEQGAQDQAAVLFLGQLVLLEQREIGLRHDHPFRGICPQVRMAEEKPDHETNRPGQEHSHNHERG